MKIYEIEDVVSFRYINESAEEINNILDDEEKLQKLYSFNTNIDIYFVLYLGG